MRKYCVQFAIIAGLMSWGDLALAQSPHRGSPEDQRACNLDVRQHCREVMTQGDMAVLACLQQHRTRLTRTCEAVLRKNGQ